MLAWTEADVSSYRTPEQHSRRMARVPSEDTSIEIAVRRALHARGLRFRKNVRSLPGTPDLVFPRARVAVFVDGDFWHGWRLPAWRDSLSPYWVEKIERNRRRDRRNFARLRRQGWVVIRVWEHDILNDLQRVTDRVEEAVRGTLSDTSASGCR
ncbi:MAG: very short patch repair endonuclease [Chloroflexota bacterium]|nr:very short patch repair endonuclease [Chloroflexota bacterium]